MSIRIGREPLAVGELYVRVEAPQIRQVFPWVLLALKVQYVKKFQGASGRPDYNFLSGDFRAVFANRNCMENVFCRKSTGRGYDDITKIHDELVHECG